MTGPRHDRVPPDASAGGSGHASGQSTGDDAGLAAHQIGKLRTFRGRREWDQTLGGEIDRARGRLDRAQRQLGAVIDTWNAVVPPALDGHVSITGLRGGVLQVSVDSSALAYELDRQLREGLLVRLRSAYRGSLHRVRVSVSGR